jgi:molybdopterin/thiamine biosynthesis adenylyltransferase
VSKIAVVGYPMNFSFLKNQNVEFDEERFDRQSFLGENSQFLISNVRIGIVGVGGGGSHIVQQLAHLGIQNYCIFEDDETDKSNLNRLIGAGLADEKESKAKTDIAIRMIQKLNPNAIIEVFGKWQESPEKIQECDIVVGGIDSFIGRRDLESECRRFMIPYIDIGMDVYNDYEGEAPCMVGQVILSMPDFPCMTCMNYLNESNLSKETAKYGKAGDKPQVVWANGILASNAIGVLVDLVTGWTKQKNKLVYLAYDGNRGIIEEHVRLRFLKTHCCSHFPIKEVSKPNFRKI